MKTEDAKFYAKAAGAVGVALVAMAGWGYLVMVFFQRCTP